MNRVFLGSGFGAIFYVRQTTVPPQKFWLTSHPEPRIWILRGARFGYYAGSEGGHESRRNPIVGVVKLNNRSEKSGWIDVSIPRQSLPRMQPFLVPKT